MRYSITNKAAREIHLMQAQSWDDCICNIEGFSRVRKVRIDCSVTASGHSIPGRFPFNGLASLSSIVEADIRGVFWPSPMVAQTISRTFPMLKILRLRQERIWCGLCNTCCIPKFQVPGPNLICYESGLGLPVRFQVNQIITTLLNTITGSLSTGILKPFPS